jgi:hypothetical protein
MSRRKQKKEVQEEPQPKVPQTIQRAEVVLHGLRPLLMSSPREVMEGTKGGGRKASKEYVDEEEAEKRAYRNKKGDLVVPARCIRACLVKAAKLYRTGRRVGISVSDMIKGSIFIEPEDVPLLDAKGRQVEDYVIDKQLVVVQRSRIVRCRPRIDDWTLRFEIRWDPRIYGLTLEQIKDVVEDAGHIGLLDYRPTYGIFGLKSIRKAK